MSRGEWKLSRPESLGEIMAGGKGPSPRRKKQRLELLKGNWRNIAGERAGEHSSPTRLSRGTLTVAADGPSWASELSIQSGVLLQRIEGVAGRGVVQRIRVQARPGGQEDASVRPGKGEREKQPGADGGGPELGEKLESELGAIEQEETRAALERLLKESIASKQYEQDDG